MNWRNIKNYNLPPETEILLRVEFVGCETPEYVTGWVTASKNIYTNGSRKVLNGGFLCDISDVGKTGITAIHYINIEEIKL